jgi:hypothetical protein
MLSGTFYFYCSIPDGIDMVPFVKFLHLNINKNNINLATDRYNMEKKLFFLEQRESTKITKIFQIILGVLCIVIAVYWIVFNIQAIKSDNKLWITIAFLVLFGIYQLLAGTGKTKKYISTEPEKIILKQNSVLPSAELKPADIEKIEIFPLSVSFRMKNRGSIRFRFGLSCPEIIEPVKNEIVGFAELNNIPLEMKDEEL